MMCILTLALLPLTSSAETSFKDLKSSHWAYSNIQSLCEKGIVKGYPDGTFKPSGTVTYGEFIKMVAVTLDGGGDIEQGYGANWAVPYYEFLLEKGIYTEGQISKSNLGKNIPRSHMALIAANIVTDTPNLSSTEISGRISDINTCGEYKDSVIKSVGTGIITGYEDYTFRPNNTLTRAEASTVIMRLIDKSVRVLPGEARKTGSRKNTDNAYPTLVDYAPINTYEADASVIGLKVAKGNDYPELKGCTSDKAYPPYVIAVKGDAHDIIMLDENKKEYAERAYDESPNLPSTDMYFEHYEKQLGETVLYPDSKLEQPHFRATLNAASYIKVVYVDSNEGVKEYFISNPYKGKKIGY